MLHKLHRLYACLIGAFISIYLFNHLLAIGVINAHISFMESFRYLYRLPVVETLLLGSVLFQICSGIYFIETQWGKGRVLLKGCKLFLVAILLFPTKPYWRSSLW